MIILQYSHILFTIIFHVINCIIKENIYYARGRKMITHEKIGFQIKLYRGINHLTQNELAIKLNICRQTLSSYERGNTLPDIIMLWKIADILHITIDELVGRDFQK